MNRKSLLSATLALVIAVCSALTVHAQQPTVAIDADDIAGVVTGPKGPEAGVWVIAETTDLPTRYIKSVVTDDQGRYVIPDLPPANYKSSCAAMGSSIPPGAHDRFIADDGGWPGCLRRQAVPHARR
jgi:hypothetical protein